MSEMVMALVHVYYLNFFCRYCMGSSENIIFPLPIMEIFNTSVTWAGVVS